MYARLGCAGCSSGCNTAPADPCADPTTAVATVPASSFWPIALAFVVGAVLAGQK